MTNREIHILYQEYKSIEELNLDDRLLANAAIQSMRLAYAPYSQFHVGAAVRLTNGEIVPGANQENAAFPSGICAERTAMFAAGVRFPDSAIVSIAIAGGVMGHLSDQPATPCGACRQVMAQYQARAGRPMSILMIAANKIWKFEKVDDILPLIFNSI